MKQFFCLLGLLVVLAVPAQASEMAHAPRYEVPSSLNHAQAPKAVAAKPASLQERIAQTLLRKAAKKAEKRQARRGTQAHFADFTAFAGLVVFIVGVISIFGNPLYGLVLVLVGALLYLLAASAGGNVGNIFR
jgi:Flp pilus assembly protein TadB